ncbi:MAG TPA: Ig-like domain-containing protein [Pilimelia sp.]|nr:Ig-like domain-containing protein [Pilimelia sp.]
MVWRGLAAVAVSGALALTAGCEKGGGLAWQGGSGKTEPQGPSAAVTTPAANATKVPASTYVTFKTEQATEAKVELTDAAGKPVKGELASDGTTWMPSTTLKYSTKYTATVTATDADGKTATTTSSFTTMPTPGKQVRVSSQLGDGAVVGVGMPLIVTFGRAVPESLRDDVQKRMIVKTTPPQEGAWHWFSGTEVYYRPKFYWKAGTKLSYRIATGGLPMGDGWYGRSDLTLDAKIGSAVIMRVDNKTKKMTVTKDGKVLRTIPVSLGKPSTPSSSGTMVVMEKLRHTVFDTYAELGPQDGYRVEIDYAQRLTWGGEFIHSAPWSVNDQGRRNVSHGCVNVSPSNAAWLFGITKVGDPVTIKGTEAKLSQGNGWTIWNLSWDQWIKGSAVPYKAPGETPAQETPAEETPAQETPAGETPAEDEEPTTY